MNRSWQLFLGVLFPVFVSLPVIGAVQVVCRPVYSVESAENSSLDRLVPIDDARAAHLAVLDTLVRTCLPFPGWRPLSGGFRDGILEVAHNLIGLPRVDVDSRRVDLRDGKIWIEGCAVGSAGADSLESLRARPMYEKSATHIFGCLRPGCTCSSRWQEGWGRALLRAPSCAQTCVALTPYGLSEEVYAIKSLVAHQYPLQTVVLIDPAYASLAQTVMPEPERSVSTVRILAIMQQLGRRGHSVFQALNSPGFVHEHGARALPAIFRAVVAEKAALQFSSWAKRLGVRVYVYDNLANYVSDCEHGVMPAADIFLNTSCTADEAGGVPLILQASSAHSPYCTSFRLSE